MKKVTNKIFTATLVSAVAVTPFATINIAHAESIDATGIAIAFNDLSSEEQQVANIVLKNVREDIGVFIESTYTGQPRTNLIAAYGELLKAIPTGLSDNDLASIVQGRYDTFIKTIKDDLSENGTDEELASYINAITTDLIVESGNVNAKDLDSFVNRLNQIITEENPMPEGVNDVMTFGNKGELARVLSEIQLEVDLVVNPESPVTKEGDGEYETTEFAVQNQTNRVILAIQQANQITHFVVDGTEATGTVAIPVTIVNALLNKNENAVLSIVTDQGSFEIPVNAINYPAYAYTLDVTTSELQVLISITTGDATPDTLLGREVIGNLLDFEIFVSTTKSITDASIEITEFDVPVGRSFSQGNQEFDPATTVAIRSNGDGTFTAKPTYVDTENGNAVAYSNTNSLYALIENFQTFKDVDGGRTVAEPYIEKLASRMIVRGVSPTEFMPGKNITRGEFAALLSRGLGIEAIEAGDGTFKDVTSSIAVNRNGEIYAAVDAGIISGYPDGTFRPSATITREQAAIMISKAMEYVGDHKIAFNKDKNSSAFTDYKQVGAAAQPHVERVYEAGYISGYPDKTYRPKTATNRGQMTIILYKFLNSVKFIN